MIKTINCPVCNARYQCNFEQVPASGDVMNCHMCLTLLCANHDGSQRRVTPEEMTRIPAALWEAIEEGRRMIYIRGFMEYRRIALELIAIFVEAYTHKDPSTLEKKVTSRIFEIMPTVEQLEGIKIKQESEADTPLESAQQFLQHLYERGVKPL